MQNKDIAMICGGKLVFFFNGDCRYDCYQNAIFTKSMKNAMSVSKSTAKSPKGQSARLVSLDVFRGMTIAFMIIVNTPGTWSHVYAPLRHAPWHGCTPTDLVFPSFLFISGVAMWFSLRKYNFEFSQPALILSLIHI